jgi:heme/copper-type cytochrome/quinol oxidase subunit 4
VEVSFLLLLVPIIALPFIGKRWSLIATYFTYGPLAIFFIFSMWLYYTNPSHMSDGLIVISGLAAGVCITMIALARVIQRRKTARTFKLPASK